MITKRHSKTRKISVAQGFKAPKVLNPSGPVFDNAKGGPYKYGNPLKATTDNLRLVELGLL